MNSMENGIEFQIRVTRMVRASKWRVDTLEYVFGPSTSLDILFQRLGAYLLTTGVTDEYREQVKYKLVEQPPLEIENIWPYLMSFSISMESDRIDNYIVEVVLD